MVLPTVMQSTPQTRSMQTTLNQLAVFTREHSYVHAPQPDLMHGLNVTPRPNPPVPDCCAWDLTGPTYQVPTLVFPAHFFLTRAHPESTSQLVTHPQIAPSQARLTLMFLSDGPQK